MTCTKCGNPFSNRLVIDGKERIFSSRSYCLTCSPFNSRNTKKLHTPLPSDDCICKRCKTDYVYKRGIGATHTYCPSCCSTNRKNKVKQQAINYLGGKCVLCGYNKFVNALDFHHLDRKTKLFNISGNFNRSWDAVKAELDKCVILCANCHREVEGSFSKLPQ
jgi:hypothetical protein